VPGQLHAEIVEAAPGGDLVRRWVYAGGAAAIWTVRRRLDPAAARVVFEHEAPHPPLLGQRGEWTFRDRPEGGCDVEVRHTISAVDETAAERVAAGLEANVPVQLRTYRLLAELRDGLTRRTVEHTAELVVPGDAVAAVARLLAEKPWRALLGVAGDATRTDLAAGVRRLEFRPSTGPDGADGILLLPLPGNRVVAKRLRPPAGVHTDLLVATAEDLIDGTTRLRVVRTATLAPLVPAEEVEDARAALSAQTVDGVRRLLAVIVAVPAS
jgi:hypothetical protein